MTHYERAVGLFMKGYNCSQATAAAFSVDFGMDEAEVLRMTAGFGGGIGGLRETCGAMSGMAFVAGLALGKYTPEDLESKTRLYQSIQRMNAEFVESFGTDVCKVLLDKYECNYAATPSERTPEYYASRPCARFVGQAAAIAARELSLQGDAEA